MGSQDDSINKRVKRLFTGVNPKGVKMTLLKGSSWGQENDSSQCVYMFDITEDFKVFCAKER
jgi:hypothetical protein